MNLKAFFHSFFGAKRSRAIARPCRRNCCKPMIEMLEDRLAPATVNWINASGGDWDTAANWSTDSVPGAGDDAVITGLNSGTSVTHSTGTDTIGSLTVGANLTISGDSTLTIASSAIIDTNVTVQAGATLNVSAGASVVGDDENFSNVAIVVDGEMNATGASFTNTATVSYLETSSIQVGSSGQLAASGCTFAWAKMSLANVVPNGTTITGNYFNLPLTILPIDANRLTNNQTFQDVIISGNLAPGQNATLAPLGTTGNQRYVFTSTVTVDAGATLNVSAGASVVGDDENFSNVAIVVDGEMNATGASFTNTATVSYLETSSIQVGSSGQLAASGCTFAWAKMSLANVVPNGTTITGNYFNLPLTILPIDANRLTNNQTFQDVIISGNLAPGQNATLAPLGTTGNQRYVFTSTVTVDAGATLNVSAGASVVGDDENFSNVAIVVDGEMNATGASFTNTATVSYLETSSIQVGSSGQLAASGCTFAWAKMSLANVVPNGTTITGNYFNLPLTILPIDANRLTNNQTFQDVIISGNLAPGQNATLAPLGTTGNQRYVFTSTVTVDAGATLNVSAGASVVGDDENFSNVAIVVDGEMNATGASFTNTATVSYLETSSIQVATGGRVVVSNCTFGWAKVTLNAGSADGFQYVTFENQLSINSGASINVSSNDLSGIGTQGIIAAGVPTATINLGNNYWGTTNTAQIAAKILDHSTNAALPTVNFNPPLGTMPQFFVTANAANLAGNAQALIIQGSGFSAVRTNDVVTFNGGATGVVTAATATQLTVGSLAHLTAGPLTASVKVSGFSSGAPVQVATVIPIITLNTANLLANKTTLVIHGFGFSTTPGNDFVNFSGPTGTVTAATTTQLTVTALSGLVAGPLDAIVQVSDAGNGSNSLGIQVSAQVQVAKVIPVITASPAALPLTATSLTINGFGFDSAVPSDNVVMFGGGVTGTVTQATLKQLTVTGLSGLAVGALTASATVDGVSSGLPVRVATEAPVVTPTTTNSVPGNTTSLTINGFGFTRASTVTLTGGTAGRVTFFSANQLTLAVTNLTAGPIAAAVRSSGISSGAPVQVATVSPVITSSTGNLAANKTLLIHGFGFSTTPGNDVVTLNGGAAIGIVTKATPTLLTVTSLSGLLVGPLTASVVSNGMVGNQPVPVQVANVIPVVSIGTVAVALNTTTLTINGFGFDAVTFGNNTVTFTDGAIGTVTGATATTLTVTVSGLTPGPIKASVTTDGVSSGAAIEVASGL